MQARLPPQFNMLALVRRIQPRDSELTAAKTHQLVVRARLLSSFDLRRYILIGSHARKTAIRTHSDLDALVVLRRNEAKWGGSIVASETLLRRAILDLKGRFPQSDIRGDRQAAVIHFSGGQESLDVVPALWARFSDGRPVYNIADGDGGWLETSPEAHQRFFAAADLRCAGKLRGVAQLLRWWKYARSSPLPLSSFHADILLAESRICKRTGKARRYGHAFSLISFQLIEKAYCLGFNISTLARSLSLQKDLPQWPPPCKSRR
jgi:predicted nucleotidyltransferase